MPDRDDLDIQGVLGRLASVLDSGTSDTEIGRILMPGPTYLGMWARDTAIVAMGLTRLGKTDLSRELLYRYWGFQITGDCDPSNFVFRNKKTAIWTDADAFQPTEGQLQAEAGAFPTSVYSQTPDFPSGTREVYSDRADLDSTAWLIIALHDQHVRSGDEALLHDLAPRVANAISYLCSRDIDGDHLLEQGPNEDWADTLLRHGKVSYTQAVWFRCLEAARGIFAVVGDQQRSTFCHRHQKAVRLAINRNLMTPYGYYANYVASEEICFRRSLDTALLVAFGVSDQVQSRRVLTMLSTLRGPFGYSVVEPGYAPQATGPTSYRPGQYHNEGIWPWITAYLALAWSKLGDYRRAREVLYSVFREQAETTHEWIDSLNGVKHHPDFTTAAGALVWAMVEAGLE